MELKEIEYREDYGDEQFLDRSLEGRRIFAELWGTFLLVFAGCVAAIVRQTYGAVSPAMEAAVPGLMVMVIIYFAGAVSGAHLNPAVTIAFAIRKNFPWSRAPLYIVAQLAGGVLACLLLRGLFGEALVHGLTLPRIGVSRAILVETLLTTGLINVILGTASGPRNIGHNAGVAIGAYITAAGFWACPLTGASMNLARSFASAAVTGNLQDAWVYLVSSLAGIALAVFFEWILKGKPSRKATREAQGGE